jgi:large subunit ribosomal protein L21
MYAIVNIAGEQVKVSEKQQVAVPRLVGEAGTKVEFANVLLLAADKETKVGSPYIQGVKIQASIVEQGKGKKVTIFKKKRRKGYKLFKGHRQYLTKIQIEKIEVA